jgi:polyhydroxyalkanoate synthesis regulator phasin
MADDNQSKKQTTKKPKAKKASAKSAATKKPAAKKAKPKKAAGKKSTATKAKKAAPKKSASKSKAKSVGIDKSFAQLRDSLEHSVTLSRDRIQEVVDDAVKRGRMTHGDAEKMIGELLKRGRKQTDALVAELEKLVRQARRKLT